MARIEEHAVIAVPPADVFDYRLDFGSNLAACNPHVREVVQIEGDGPGVGSKYRVRVRLGGFHGRQHDLWTEAVRASKVCDIAEAFIHAHETVSFEAVALSGGRTGTQVRFLVVSSSAWLGGADLRRCPRTVSNSTSGAHRAEVDAPGPRSATHH